VTHIALRRIPGACGSHLQVLPITWSEKHMSKGQDRKKETKKKPAKTLDEKRAAKRAKKEGRGFSV
jgi:hypothetical protein